jgi:hypothetical protein
MCTILVGEDLLVEVLLIEEEVDLEVVNKVNRVFHQIEEGKEECQIVVVEVEPNVLLIGVEEVIQQVLF